MSLRDTIKDLRNTVKSLSKADFNSKFDALKKFLDSIKVTPITIPTEDFFAALLVKFLRGSNDFTRRELRSLPFIIYKPEVTFNGAKNILRRLNLFHAGQLRGHVTIYLLNCDGSDKTELSAASEFPAGEHGGQFVDGAENFCGAGISLRR